MTATTSTRMTTYTTTTSTLSTISTTSIDSMTSKMKALKISEVAEPVVTGNNYMDIHNWLKSGDMVILCYIGAKGREGKKEILYIATCAFHKCIKEKEGKKQEGTGTFEHRVIEVYVEDPKLLQKEEWPDMFAQDGHREGYKKCGCEFGKKASTFTEITSNTFTFTVPKVSDISWDQPTEIDKNYFNWYRIIHSPAKA